jgi:hypothetical protein
MSILQSGFITAYVEEEGLIGAAGWGGRGRGITFRKVHFKKKKYGTKC